MSADDREVNAQRFRDGLESERRIYESLIDLTTRQQEIVASGDTDQILALAQAKKEILNQIDVAEQELAPLKQSWPDDRDQVEVGLRKSVEEQIDGVGAVLRQLIELETDGQVRVTQQREATASRIRSVEGGRRMQQAYMSSTPPARPRYLDRTE